MLPQITPGSLAAKQKNLAGRKYKPKPFPREGGSLGQSHATRAPTAPGALGAFKRTLFSAGHHQPVSLRLLHVKKPQPLSLPCSRLEVKIHTTLCTFNFSYNTGLKCGGEPHWLNSYKQSCKKTEIKQVNPFLSQASRYCKSR